MDDFTAKLHAMQPTWAWGKASAEREEEVRLPVRQYITENLDRDNLEQASMDKEIPPSNVGFKLLQRMGWKHGKGLGKSQQGIVDPIRTNMNEFRLGLGKQEQDDFYTNEENIERKKLNVEIEETEEMVQKREEEAKRVEKIQAEVKEIKKVFYCELCNKQYKLASEMEVHLSSYDHNHKKRFKESMSRMSNKEKEERQRREALREQKELQKRLESQMAAKGATTTQAPAAAPLATPLAQPAAIPVAPDGVRRGTALKFGFGGKGKASSKAKPGLGGGKAKGKPGPVASIFGGPDDDEDDDDN